MDLPGWIWGLLLFIWGARSVIAAVGIVWLINLYNFMDGIDGIAGTEAMCSARCRCFTFWTGSAGLACMLNPSYGSWWLFGLELVPG